MVDASPCALLLMSSIPNLIEIRRRGCNYEVDDGREITGHGEIGNSRYDIRIIIILPAEVSQGEVHLKELDLVELGSLFRNGSDESYSDTSGSCTANAKGPGWFNGSWSSSLETWH